MFYSQIKLYNYVSIKFFEKPNIYGFYLQCYSEAINYSVNFIRKKKLNKFKKSMYKAIGWLNAYIFLMRFKILYNNIELSNI